MAFRVLVVALVVLAAHGPIAAPTPDVGFSVDDVGAIRVPVTIDGSGPFSFLLDTGSSHSVVAGDVVRRLALPAVAKTTVVTSAGSELRLVVALLRPSIGTASMERLLASVVPSARLRETMPGVDGVIGQDFLSAFNYTIDYRGKRLGWTGEPGHPQPGVRVDLVWRGGRFLARLSAAGVPLLLALDSGAERLVIFEHGDRTRLTLDPSEGFAEIFGLTGRREARKATLGDVRMGEMRLGRQPVIVLDRRGIDAAEGDGLLPLHLFSSVSINSGEGYIIVRK